MTDILNEIIENIINTPDDEILEKVKNEYGDSEYEANIVRKIISNVKNNLSGLRED